MEADVSAFVTVAETAGGSWVINPEKVCNVGRYISAASAKMLQLDSLNNVGSHCRANCRVLVFGGD